MRSRKLLFAAAAVLSLGGSAPAYAADPCPNADIRAQQRSEYLPSCRAYEQVSPVEKGGMPAENTQIIGITRASSDGNAFVFPSWGNFAGAVGGMPTTYRARRSAAGWTSEAVTPAPGFPFAEAGNHNTLWIEAATDLGVGYALTRDRFDPTDVSTDPLGNYDIYRTGPNQFTELISRGNGAERIGPDKQADFAQGASTSSVGAPSVSRDGSHVLFRTDARLVAPDDERYESPGDGRALDDVYDRVGGKTHLVNLDDDENLVNRCGSVLGDGGIAIDRAISPDGSRIVFTTPNPDGFTEGPDCSEPRQVYVRIDHDETVRVSASQRTDCATEDPCTGTPSPDPVGTQSAYFVGASGDGRYVFFSAGEMLTDDATDVYGDWANNHGLYRYDMETGELELFQRGGPYLQVSRISADGSTVYFVSQATYLPEAVAGNYHLYAKRGEEIKLVGSSSDLSFWFLGGGDEAGRQATVTPNGRHLLFATSATLGSFDHQGRQAVYLYDFDEDDLTCVSCDPAGQRPADSTVASDASFSGGQDLNPAISPDGETAVFQSGDRLVAQDANSVADVYGYSDGRLSLISAGARGSIGSFLIGMAGEGQSVFFNTGDDLLSADRDGNMDIYAARVGGGFPEPDAPEPEVRCGGDGCQGPPAPPPGPPLLASLVFEGAGDAGRSPGPVRVSIAKAGAVRGTRARLRVKVSRKSRIVVSGAGIRRAGKVAGRAATYEVPVVLDRRARRELREKGSVRVKVTVRVVAAAGRSTSKTLRLSFRKPSRRADVPSTNDRKGR